MSSKGVMEVEGLQRFKKRRKNREKATKG
jgi:hypothetical protein